MQRTNKRISGDRIATIPVSMRRKKTPRGALTNVRGRLRDRTFTQIACIAALVLALCGTAHTEEIAVGNFGVPANGIPFRVAHVKGFVKEEGANVTGIITSAGGGTSLRTMLAGSVPYGQVNPGLVVAAIQQGADRKLISDNVLTMVEFVGAVRPDSPIRSIGDTTGTSSWR